jgi:hypothetical protein
VASPRPAGFWTVRIPDGALQRGPGGIVRLHVKDLEILDSFTFLGPVEIPATVSYDIIWKAQGAVRHIAPLSTDPADPHNWAGEFRNAVATGTFAGFEAGFSFQGVGTSEGVFAELGWERNGVFVR